MPIRHGRIIALCLLATAYCWATPAFSHDDAPGAEPSALLCASGPDCSLKWGRALAWVSQNAPYKLRIATDLIITTEGPIDEFGYSMKSAITVNRVDRGDGTSEISFSSACANMFGCSPTHEALFASFSDFVNPRPMSSNPRPALRLGIHVMALDPAGIAAIHLDSDHGLLVAVVDPESPAAKAGVVQGDVIVSVAGRQVRSIADVMAAINAIPPDAEVPIGMLRGNKPVELKLHP